MEGFGYTDLKLKRDAEATDDSFRVISLYVNENQEVSETVQKEYALRLKEWAKDKTLQTTNVTWREKPAKENQGCWL